VQHESRADRADPLLLNSLSLLAIFGPHLRDAAPRAAAAVEPGLVAALARTLGRAARVPPGADGTPAALGTSMLTAGRAAAVLEATLAGSGGAQRAAEFVHAGGAGHLVRAAPARGLESGQGADPGLFEGVRARPSLRLGGGRGPHHWAFANAATKPVLFSSTPKAPTNQTRRRGLTHSPQHAHIHAMRPNPLPCRLRCCQRCPVTMRRRARRRRR
jgi:hypothetical protein